MLYSYSDLHSYKSIKIPKFGPEEVLVQVKGASINPIDKIQTTKIPFLRWWFPWTIGRDVAGIIVDIGANVRKFQIGEQVYGKAVGGSLQEYTNCNQDQIAHKPNNTSFVEAASLGLAGLTSLQSLNWFRNLNSNDKVLIIGASGGCGSLAVQIAKSYGAKVYGVCSQKNIKFVKELGCDVIIDYTNPNFLIDIQDVSFDLIYDTVTSADDADQEKIFGSNLSNTGYYVATNTGDMLNFARSMIRLEKSHYHLHMLKWNTADLDTLRELVESNKLKPLGCETYHLNDINVAFDKLKSRRTVGKIAFEI